MTESFIRLPCEACEDSEDLRIGRDDDEATSRARQICRSIRSTTRRDASRTWACLMLFGTGPIWADLRLSRNLDRAVSMERITSRRSLFCVIILFRGQWG